MYSLDTIGVCVCVFMQNLQVLSDDLSRLREETNSYICMVDDLQSNYDSNYSRLEEYKEN